MSIVNHHLQYGVHVACLSEIEKTPYTFPTTWLGLCILSNVSLVLFGKCWCFPLPRRKETRIIDNILTPTTVHVLRVDGELVFCLGEVLIQAFERGTGVTRQACVHYQILKPVFTLFPDGSDLVQFLLTQMFAAIRWHMRWRHSAGVAAISALTTRNRCDLKIGCR